MIYDFENLFNAYKAGIKCKRYRPDVMAYTDKLEENLIELQNEFIWQTYTVGRYNIFYVYEPKKRMIMSLTFKDRVAQHAIYSQLNPYFEKQFISDSYACRVGRGTHKAVNRLHDWLKQTDRKPQRFYYLKLDIAKYFYRIDHEVLMDILRKKIADEDLLHVLSVIINCEDTNFGLPLGADIGDVAFDALHSTFAVALVAMPGHTGFVNEFTGAAAFATSNYIRHIHTPLHCADKIRTGKRPELGCVYSWKLWYFPCDTVIHNFVYAAFVYRQIVFISITFPVCRVRVLHHE